ncbi:MAG: rod shape-determining protein MreC [Gloeobacteraceae cyanobacterium ES-bin-316]|nr:rod shape-determining protein MreC [Ferruginibacter sp.]
MRNIFLFIRRYFNFLVFLILQVLCITLIVQYSKYHQAMFGNSANNITGKVNAQYDRVEYYFQLKKTNDSLVKANERLYNKLASNFSLPDSGSKEVVDSIRIDSILQYRKFNYLHAKVVANAVTTQSNFIVLQTVNTAQMRVGMGIVGPNNEVVGVITELSGEFAVVMSLLHKDSKISGKLFKTGETGTISWDGKYPNLVTLTGIPKSTKVLKGDSVITSGFSTIFPKGLLIGKVDEVYLETATNNYRIVVRTATNFYNLEWAYAINNIQQPAIDELLEKAKNSSK